MEGNLWAFFKPGRSRSMYVILLFLSCMILRGQSFREFPIIGYCGEDFLISDTDFSRLREAGFNACLCYYPNMATAKRALDNAKPHDVGLILYVPEVRSDAHILLDSLGNHTNLLAFFLYDEPRMGQKEWLQNIVNEFHKASQKGRIAPNVYVNLFPYYNSSMIRTTLEADSYKSYLQSFSSVVGNQYSFDYYPIIDRGVRKSWYDNLKIVRDVSKQEGKPFWAYILSTPHNVYPQPTLGSLRLQTFVSLIYGAKGIQYFTYTTPSPQGLNDYHNGPVERDGHLTSTYFLAQQMNEGIKDVYRFFSGGELGEVVRIPYGQENISNYIPIKGKLNSAFGVLAAQLHFDGEQYYAIVNLDYEENAVLSFGSSSYLYYKNHQWIKLPKQLYLLPGDLLLMKTH